jgi:hypothetical protein
VFEGSFRVEVFPLTRHKADVVKRWRAAAEFPSYQDMAFEDSLARVVGDITQCRVKVSFASRETWPVSWEGMSSPSSQLTRRLRPN